MATGIITVIAKADGDSKTIQLVSSEHTQPSSNEFRVALGLLSHEGFESGKTKGSFMTDAGVSLKDNSSQLWPI